MIRLSDGTLVGAWTRQTDPVREAMDLQLSRSGDNGKTLAGVSHGATSGFPRMIPRGNELVFASTESMSGSDEEASMTVITAVAACRDYFADGVSVGAEISL